MLIRLIAPRVGYSVGKWTSLRLIIAPTFLRGKLTVFIKILGEKNFTSLDPVLDIFTFCLPWIQVPHSTWRDWLEQMISMSYPALWLLPGLGPWDTPMGREGERYTGRVLSEICPLPLFKASAPGRQATSPRSHAARGLVIAPCFRPYREW